MNCMRINCAHDDASTWAAMIANLRRAEESPSAGRAASSWTSQDPSFGRVRSLPGAAVARSAARARRHGRVIAPARVWLYGEGQPSRRLRLRTGASPCRPLARAAAAARHHRAHDARGAKRELVVVAADRGGRLGRKRQDDLFRSGHRPHASHCRRPRTRRECRRSGGARESARAAHGATCLILTRNLEPGRPATSDAAGRVLTPATIGCTLPEFFEPHSHGRAHLVSTTARSAAHREDRARSPVRALTHALPPGSKLGADKGINLPQSNLDLSAMTPDGPSRVSHLRPSMRT